MKNQNSPKKLILNKERIAQLTEREMESVIGGDGSTLHDFTCSWCTSGYGQVYGSGGTVYGSYSSGPVDYNINVTPTTSSVGASVTIHF